MILINSAESMIWTETSLLYALINDEEAHEHHEYKCIQFLITAFVTCSLDTN